MRPKTALLVGLLAGGLTSFAYLLFPLTLFPALGLWAWLLQRQPRRPAVAGGLIGFGTIWLVLIGRATWACVGADSTCAEPSLLWLWLAIGAAFLVLGLLLALATRDQLLRR
jgi:hypothetical protein